MAGRWDFDDEEDEERTEQEQRAEPSTTAMS